jgi:hypothetical protein
MSALVPCSACARHVRSDASSCPFCGAARAASVRPVQRVPRVSRAVLFTAGASLSLGLGVGALAATAHADTFDATSMVPQYGAPSRYEPFPDPPPTLLPLASNTQARYSAL